MILTKKQKSSVTRSERLTELAEFRYRLRRFLGFSEMAAEEAGISAQQYQLLQVVATIPEDRGCSISYIAERMLLRHNSAVELVDRAARSNLVRRVADEADHRRSLVELTERGNRLLVTLAEAHLREIDEEGAELLRALQQLVGNRQAGKRNGTR
ncbi:MAG TPA: MarR family transcriptional regulator [Edaphobacter sp.]|jgi:DNA-binding MarR family transcriptional regulator|nr:MarR family transcriptional regulator [Edaphobacter sp.]